MKFDMFVALLLSLFSLSLKIVWYCSCCFLTTIKIKKNLKILLINENITVSSVQIYSKATMLTPKEYYATFPFWGYLILQLLPIGML